MRHDARPMVHRLSLAVVLLAAALGLVSACQSYRDGDRRTPGQVTDDVAIQTAVVSRFLADPQVAGMKIRTEVYNGVVTLYGGVPDENTRRLALALARDVKGVLQVQDRLTIVAP
jgi:hyperosmotically inducible protein